MGEESLGVCLLHAIALPKPHNERIEIVPLVDEQARRAVRLHFNVHAEQERTLCAFAPRCRRDVHAARATSAGRTRCLRGPVTTHLLRGSEAPAGRVRG